MSDTVDIIIGADILPMSSNAELFSSCEPADLVGSELSDILSDADFRVFNLEGPLTDKKNPLLKSGPVLSAPEKTIHGIKKLQPDLLALSNNHILDHDQIGVDRTISLLQQNNIAYIGIGKTDMERRKPFLFEKNGIKVGVYNCCEHEFSVRKEGGWGAAPYDPLVSFDDVRELKEQCDFAVVLYHGGKEYFRYPSPRLQKVFRKFAASGADAVFAQHTHCIGSAEVFKDSLLVYGQGNFLFDIGSSEFLDTGLLVKLRFSRGKAMQFEYIPVCRNGNRTRLAAAAEKENILHALEARSMHLSDTEFIQNEYQKKAAEYLRGYLLNMHAGTKLDTVFIRLFLKMPGRIQRRLFPRTLEHLLATRNYVQCQAHRELLLAGMNLLRI